MEEFINKECTDLENFVITKDFSVADLEKLAELNNINLAVSEGWYPLIIDLVKELNKNNWNRRVNCIKEKHARLEFYIDGEQHSSIISKYGLKSTETCEECGKKGYQRFNSPYLYVACREHYWLGRGIIICNQKGYEVLDNFFYWKEIEDAQFYEGFGSFKYSIQITFNNSLKGIDKSLSNGNLIFNTAVGYGKFINSLPQNFKSLDYNYIENTFSKVLFCETCGFLAVYNDFCECCENKRWTSESINYWPKDEYIKYNQIEWQEDDGDRYAKDFYQKNKAHKIVFTDKEFDEYWKE